MTTGRLTSRNPVPPRDGASSAAPRRLDADAPLGPRDRRVGILGGTFDPIHYGHLAVAEQVAGALRLDRILFIPAHVPPHKPGVVISPPEDRLAMVRLAVAGNPRFLASTIELRRDGPSYTVDTLEELVEEAAAQGVEREFELILSTESLAGLPAWRDPWRLITLCHVAVVPRPGYPYPDRSWLEARFPGRSDRIAPVETIQVTNSASEIRRRVAAGGSVRYLVPPEIEAYIRDHRLYRS